MKLEVFSSAELGEILKYARNEREVMILLQLGVNKVGDNNLVTTDTDVKRHFSICCLTDSLSRHNFVIMMQDGWGEEHGRRRHAVSLPQVGDIPFLSGRLAHFR